MESKTLADMGSCRGRLKLMRGVIEMVDLIVLVAYYINFIPGFSRLKGLSALRMVRLLRVAALLKVERKTSSFSKIVSVLKTKKSELMATLFTAAVLMVMSASMMYYIEKPMQPVAFQSVPAAMWWSVTALTTVGYGDVVPMTPFGKVLGSIVAFFGVGLFALPAGILGSGFVEEVDKAKREEMARDGVPEDDEADEMLEEEAEETTMITGLADHMESLCSKIAGLQGGQREIVNLLRRNGLAAGTQGPSGSEVHDRHLDILQSSVSTKINNLRLRTS